MVFKTRQVQAISAMKASLLLGLLPIAFASTVTTNVETSYGPVFGSPRGHSLRSAASGEPSLDVTKAANSMADCRQRNNIWTDLLELSNRRPAGWS